MRFSVERRSLNRAVPTPWAEDYEAVLPQFVGSFDNHVTSNYPVLVREPLMSGLVGWYCAPNSPI